MTLTTSEEAVSVRDGYYMGPLYNWCLIQIQFLIPWKIETLTFIFHSKSHLFCWNVWNWLFYLNFMVKIQKFWFPPSDFVAIIVVAALSSAKPELSSLGTTMRWKLTFLFTRRKWVVLFRSDSPNTDFPKQGEKRRDVDKNIDKTVTHLLMWQIIFLGKKVMSSLLLFFSQI